MANYSKEITHMLDRLYTKLLSFDKNGVYKDGLHQKLNLMEFLIVKKIGDAGTIRLNVLIDQMEIDRNLVTTTIKKLCSMKIAKKMQDPEDGRGQLISLQPDGELLYKRLLEIQKSEIDFVLNDVTINEEKTILKFISKIVQYHTDKFEIK
jgi:DNA-binding MarR family transcriptional regulator